MGTAEVFVSTMSAPGDVPLARALFALAGARPGAPDPTAAGLEQLDRLAASCPAPTLDALLGHLFTDLGFRGDRVDYHDPRNSFLDEVLARRTGMPITLSVVLIEVGTRLGIALDGVGMPGHFLVRVRGADDEFVDAFDGSR